MFLAVVCVVMAVLFSTANGQCKTPYNDCGSADMTITSISVPNCCSPPCVLKRGTNVSVTIDFSINKTYAQMTQKLCGEFGKSCIGLGSLPGDFCKYTTCPVEAGTKYSAVVALPVLSTYPPVSTTGNWTFYGPDKTKFVGCFEVPLQIQ